MRITIVLVLAACGGAPGNQGDDDDTHADAAQGSDGSTSTAACDGLMPPQTDATWTLTVGALQRTAQVHVPASYDASKRTPLVINAHGRTSTASQQALLSHAIAKSDSAGFIVIHPEAWGSPTSWNAGGGCCDPSYSNNIDDSGFISQLITEAATKLCIDPARVYVMGLSNGAYLANRLACEHGDQIAAIGPVAGGLSLQSCAPTRPMPVFAVHGTGDQIVSYSFDQQTIDFWKAKNQCTTTTTTYQQGDATCVTHGGCAAGADVVLCTITDGGHQWPGGEEIPFLGKKSDNLIATDAIWDFFVAHPKP